MDRRRFARGHSSIQRRYPAAASAADGQRAERPLRFFPAAKGRLFGALYLPEGHDLSCHRGGKHNETRRKLAHYGEDCLGKALMPAGENSKRTCHWMGTLRPPTSRSEERRVGKE